MKAASILCDSAGNHDLHLQQHVCIQLLRTQDQRARIDNADLCSHSACRVDFYCIMMETVLPEIISTADNVHWVDLAQLNEQFESALSN